MCEGQVNAAEIAELEQAIGFPVADGDEPTDEGREFCRQYGHASDYSQHPSSICMRCGEPRNA